MTRRLRIAALLCALILLCSGCASFGVDVERQLRPPKTIGDQGEVERALEAYITATLTQENYTFKYPRTGQYRSAFVLVDLDGDGSEEALAFYTLGAESGSTHVNMLRRTDGVWQSVSDHESVSADIYSICFGDVDGDRVNELFVLWDMYSSRTYRLSMYSLAGNRIAERFTDTCSLLAVTDFTGDGWDDCLLFMVEGETLSARLWTMRYGEMTDLGQSVVDTYVQTLSTPLIFDVAADRKGVLVDCQKSGGDMVTELVYWDRDRLCAPLYNSDAAGTQFTQRTPPIPISDVDGDGVWEFPVCTPLTDHKEAGADAPTVYWQTSFWCWDADQAQTVEKFSCLFNSSDRYYMLVDKNFCETFTTEYVASSRTLWVYELYNGAAGAAVYAVRLLSSGAADGGEDVLYTFEQVAKSGDNAVAVWYAPDNPYGINTETLRYMLTLL